MIDELEQIEINGTKQWILTRSKNPTLPVLLFVHGGPGSPLMYFSRAFDEIYLKKFTVVHWDQRHSGKSFDSQNDIKSFTISQVCEDGLALAKIIKKKLQNPKIVLLGHSWGSIIAFHMASLSPNSFAHFVTIGTVVNMEKADELKYVFLKNEIEIKGNSDDLEAFERMGHPPWLKYENLTLHSYLMMKFKGTFHNLTMDQISKAVELNQEYSSVEMENLEVAMKEICEEVMPSLRKYNAIHSIAQVKTPITFIQGRYDMATPTALARDYFNMIGATRGKAWFEIEDSAHFPMYENPEQFLEILEGLNIDEY